jgi:hypothetical protein
MPFWLPSLMEQMFSMSLDERDQKMLQRKG